MRMWDKFNGATQLLMYLYMRYRVVSRAKIDFLLSELLSTRKKSFDFDVCCEYGLWTRMDDTSNMRNVRVSIADRQIDWQATDSDINQIDNNIILMKLGSREVYRRPVDSLHPTNRASANSLFVCAHVSQVLLAPAEPLYPAFPILIDWDSFICYNVLLNGTKWFNCIIHFKSNSNFGGMRINCPNISMY